MGNFKYALYKGNPLGRGAKVVQGEFVASGENMVMALHKTGRIGGVSNLLGKMPSGECVFWVDPSWTSTKNFDYATVYSITCPLCGDGGVKKGDFLCDECDQIART